jgi:hypothetical protein
MNEESAVTELFARNARRIRDIEPAMPEEVRELEQLLGRRLPREYRAYLFLAGRKSGNLKFVQTHKIIQPAMDATLDAHRPRKHGRRKRMARGLIFFGDGGTCQDCGPAYLALEAPPGCPD